MTTEYTMTRDEWIKAFVAEMLKQAGFATFDDGTSVADYARDVAPTYYDDPALRADGIAACVEADMDYWGE